MISSGLGQVVVARQTSGAELQRIVNAASTVTEEDLGLQWQLLQLGHIGHDLKESKYLLIYMIFTYIYIIYQIALRGENAPLDMGPVELEDNMVLFATRQWIRSMEDGL